MKFYKIFSMLALFPTPYYYRAEIPPNDDCLDAIEIDLTSTTSGSVIIFGNTTEATQDREWFGFPLGFCGVTIDAPGIWYKFKNIFTEKTAITISTCRDGTDFDTKVTVFKGANNDCGNTGVFACVGGDDDHGSDECGSKSRYTFLVTDPTWYYILVHGCNSCPDGATGQFEMEVTTASSYINVIDSDNNRFASVLGDFLEYYKIPSTSSKLNFQAVFSSDIPVKSVKVAFDDEPSRCDRFAPYAVFWERRGNYHGKTIQKGLHKVTATPYAQGGCQGSAGTPMVKEFVVDGCLWVNSIYDAKRDYTVQYMWANEAYTPSLPCNFNMEIVPLCGFNIDNIRMVVRNEKGKVVRDFTERKSPYFLYGDHNDYVESGKLSPGNYTMNTYINGIEHDMFSLSVGNDACT